MLRMVSHPHRPQCGQIMCYLNRTYHVLPTTRPKRVDFQSCSLPHFRHLKGVHVYKHCLHRRAAQIFQQLFFLVNAGKLEAGL
jgi:hypothetical protein